MDATVGIEQFQQLYANNKGRSIVDVLDLAVNLKIATAIGSSILHHGHAAEKSARSSPELRMNSPVYLQDVLIGGPSSEPAAPFRVTSNTDAPGGTSSLIDALDLAVDRSIFKTYRLILDSYVS